MPDPFLNARFRLTRLFEKAAADYGIGFPEVEHAIRNYESASPGSAVGQWWYFGSLLNGREIKVLAAHSGDEVALITMIVLR